MGYPRMQATRRWSRVSQSCTGAQSTLTVQAVTYFGLGRTQPIYLSGTDTPRHAASDHLVGPWESSFGSTSARLVTLTSVSRLLGWAAAIAFVPLASLTSFDLLLFFLQERLRGGWGFAGLVYLLLGAVSSLLLLAAAVMGSLVSAGVALLLLLGFLPLVSQLPCGGGHPAPQPTACAASLYATAALLHPHQALVVDPTAARLVWHSFSLLRVLSFYS